MPTREEFVANARTYIGTPIVHQGRNPEVGLDCAGVLVANCKALGLVVKDCANYGRDHVGAAYATMLGSQLTLREGVSRIEAGDVLWFKMRKVEQHLGIVTDFKCGGLGLLHAYQHQGTKGCVLEHELTPNWIRRIKAVYHLIEWQQYY